jgi:hypothetical protein
MDIFLLNKKDIDSTTILHKNLSNMHIVLHNMHIAHIYIAANISYVDKHPVFINRGWLSGMDMDLYKSRIPDKVS